MEYLDTYIFMYIWIHFTVPLGAFLKALSEHQKYFISAVILVYIYLHIYKRGMTLVPVKFVVMNLTAGVLGWRVGQGR